MMIQITIDWLIKIHTHYQVEHFFNSEVWNCCFFTFIDGFSQDVTLHVFNWGLHKSLVTLSLYFMHDFSCLMVSFVSINWCIIYGLILSQQTVHSKIQTIFLRYIKSHWLLISPHWYHMRPIDFNDKVCARLICSLSLTWQWIMVMPQP